MGVMYFNLKFITNSSGIFGIYMPPSVPLFSKLPLSSFSFSYLYLKTWICPNNTFFNSSSNLCEYCSIPNCISCINLTQCQQCNNNYFQNISAMPSLQCTTCQISNCITCSSPTTCASCNESNNYFL